MASKNERIEIRMRLLGAKQVAEEGAVAGKGIRGVGRASEYTGTMSMRAAKKTSLLTRAYGNLKRAAKYAFAGIAIGGVFTVKSAITKTAELGKATWTLNRNLGLTTKVASRWAAVGQARGIDAKAMGQGFAILSSKMTEAGRKGGHALTPFRQIGLSLANVKKGAHNANWGIMRVAKALSEAHGGAKRMTAMKGLLGKGWATMGPLFANPKELQEQLHWADKYGVTLDTKTNKSLHRMALAFAQSKMAMEGLQVHLAKALMPTIIAANGQFQKFVLTLNSNKLSSSQKIARISQQFLSLENTLVRVVEAALPKVAEAGGTLGVKLAGAVVKGFLNAGIWGKLVISAWLLKFMGGGGLIKKTAGWAGRRMALALVSTFLPTLAAEFAITGSVGLMLKGRLARFTPLFARWGGRLGRVFGLSFITLGLYLVITDSGTRSSLVKYGNALGGLLMKGFVWTINKGIDAINWTLNHGNALAFLGVEAPQLGHVSTKSFEMGIPGAAGGVLGTPGNWPKEPTGHQRKQRGKRHHAPEQHDHTKPRHKLSALEGGGGGKKTVVFQVNLDGKVLAQRVLNHAEAAAALA